MEKADGLRMRELIITALNYAVEKNITVSVRSSDDMLNFYDGTTGQREVYITPYGPGDGVPKMWPFTYKLRRKLSFTNTGDEGKSGAVLAVLSLHESKFHEKLHLKISRNVIEVGTIILHFRDNIL